MSFKYDKAVFLQPNFFYVFIYDLDYMARYTHKE